MHRFFAAASIVLITGAAGCDGSRGDGPPAFADESPPSTGITLTLTAPGPAEDFKVGIDGGPIGSQLRVIMVPADGAARATTTIPLPAGGPYRVRAIARRAGTGTGDAPGWATGKATGIVVQEGSLAEASVPVAPYSVEVSAPEMVTRGEEFTVRWTYTDPGDVLEDGGTLGGPAGAVHFSLDGIRDAGGESVSATGVRLGEGRYEMTAVVVAPLADPGSLYFQVVGYTFGNFAQPVPIALFDPSSARGEEMLTMGIL